MSYRCPICGQNHDTTACPSMPVNNQFPGNFTPHGAAFIYDYTSVLNRIADALERIATLLELEE